MPARAAGIVATDKNETDKNEVVVLLELSVRSVNRESIVMERRAHALLLLSLSASIFLLAGPSGAAPPGPAAPGPAVVQWHDDLDSAHKFAVETDKPMLLVFGAQWCHYCRKLKATTLSDAAMVQYVNENFVPVRLDVDQHRRIAKILGVKPIPCSVVLSPEADLLGKLVGYHGPKKYYVTLQNARRLQAEIRQAEHSRVAPRR